MDKAIALARKALESTYTGLCAIVEYQEVVVNYETRTEEVTIIKDQPCKLSKKTIGSANQSEVAMVLLESIKGVVSLLSMKLTKS